MGHSHTAGFLGVIIEVCLSIHISVITNDLDGVLISTYSTISAQTPELTVGCSCRSSIRVFIAVQRKIGDIIVDTDGEFFLGEALELPAEFEIEDIS